MMNLRHLEVFRMVMQTGSIKGAAALMHVSEAAVSKLLGTAERRMGLALFERTRSRLIATPEAHRLYEDVAQLWDRVERIEGLTRALANPDSDALALSVSPSLGTTIIPAAVTVLLARIPQLTISIEMPMPHLLLQALVDGTADVGVALSPQQHPNLQVLNRYPCQLVCVMPIGHALANKSVVGAGDLRGHTVISFPQALAYGITEELLYGRHRDAIAFRLNVRSGQAACWLSLAGAGVAIVDAATTAQGAFAALAVRPYRCAAKLEINVMRHRNRPLSRAAQLFCEVFEKTWKRLDSARGIG